MSQSSMFKKIQQLETKLLCGLDIEMSIADNRTGQLWSSFMPQKKAIKNSVSTDLYSMQVYDKGTDFKTMKPTSVFTKWAAIEVSDHSSIPSTLKPYVLNSGLYAVFIHIGLPQDFPKTFGYIFKDWLPNAAYDIDEREHFELLSENYRPDDPMAEEEIWIPVKEKVNPIKAS